MTEMNEFKTLNRIIFSAITALIIALFSIIGCTENERAKNFGGTAKITLPENQKLVTVTWKETSLWYVTKPMVESDSAEIYTFQEESSFGLMEGKYVIVEKKTAISK